MLRTPFLGAWLPAALLRPDAARISFTLTTQRATVKEARLESDRQSKVVKEALQALKVKDLEVVAAAENMSMVGVAPAGGGGFPGGGGPLVYNLQVRSQFGVTVREADPDKLQEL